MLLGCRLYIFPLLLLKFVMYFLYIQAFFINKHNLRQWMISHLITNQLAYFNEGALAQQNVFATTLYCHSNSHEMFLFPIFGQLVKYVILKCLTCWRETTVHNTITIFKNKILLFYIVLKFHEEYRFFMNLIYD